MHPSRFAADYRPEHSRLTAFFRLFLVIPHLIVVSLWGIAAFLTLIVAWFAVVFTGRYPKGLYDFHAGFLRQMTAVNGYFLLLDDRYPPFSSDPDYGVRLIIGEPQAEYSRVLALFRAFLYIPVYIVAYALSIVAMVGAFLAWFAEVFTGKLPRGLYEMIVLGISYQQRAYAYLFLIDDQFPAFTDNAAGQIGTAPSGGGLPPTSSSPTAAPPRAPEAPGMASSAGPSSSSTGMTGGDPLAG